MAPQGCKKVLMYTLRVLEVVGFGANHTYYTHECCSCTRTLAPPHYITKAVKVKDQSASQF